MRLPEFAESFVVKMAISKSGPLIIKATTALVAAIIATLAQKVPGIEIYLNEYVLTGILWVGIDYLYDLLPASIRQKYGKELQNVLNQNGAGVKIDGYVGPQTLKAVSEKIKPLS